MGRVQVVCPLKGFINQWEIAIDSFTIATYHEKLCLKSTN